MRAPAFLQRLSTRQHCPPGKVERGIQEQSVYPTNCASSLKGVCCATGKRGKATTVVSFTRAALRCSATSAPVFYYRSRRWEMADILLSPAKCPVATVNFFSFFLSSHSIASVAFACTSAQFICSYSAQRSLPGLSADVFRTVVCYFVVCCVSFRSKCQRRRHWTGACGEEKKKERACTLAGRQPFLRLAAASTW